MNQENKILVIDSTIERHEYWRICLSLINKFSYEICPYIYDHNNSNVKKLIKNMTGSQLRHEEKNPIFLNKIRQYFIEPTNFNLIFLHYNNLFSDYYANNYGDQIPIVFFSGGHLDRFLPKKSLVNYISSVLRDEKDFDDLDWKNAFNNFTLGRRFPVHLLRASIPNICGFLILLQGYIAANLSDYTIRENDLLPGWDKIKKNIVLRKNQAKTSEEDWWKAVPIDDLLFELKNIGNETEKIDKTISCIEIFFKSFPNPSDFSVIELYHNLKGLILSK